MRYLIFLFAWLVTFLTGFSQHLQKIEGVSLESPPQVVGSGEYQALVDVGANWVGIIPYGFSRQNEPEVYFNNERQWWGEREEGVKVLVNLARDKGLKVMIKPQVWVSRSWVGDFTCETEEDWLVWEASYRNYIVLFAQLSERLGVEMYCIGTEYRNAVLERPQFWSRLISEVRNLYSGSITYAANWDEYEEVPFWGELDYIGVNAYFPLSQSTEPLFGELVAAWKKPKARMKQLSEKFEKPILLTEFGYRSVSGAAGNQWETLHNAPDVESQRRAYLALFESLWNEQWLHGGFFWKWEFRNRDEEVTNTRYTPQGKETLRVIEQVYK